MIVPHTFVVNHENEEETERENSPLSKRQKTEKNKQKIPRMPLPLVIIFF
jgi:hypothetical protein